MKVQEEIGCWSCAVDGIKTGKPVCPECGTEKSHFCGSYNHEKVWVEKNVKDMETEDKELETSEKEKADGDGLSLE